MRSRQTDRWQNYPLRSPEKDKDKDTGKDTERYRERHRETQSETERHNATQREQMPRQNDTRTDGISIPQQ